MVVVPWGAIELCRSEAKGVGSVWKASWKVENWSEPLKEIDISHAERKELWKREQSLQDWRAVIRGDTEEISKDKPVTTFVHLENSGKSLKDFKQDFHISRPPGCKFHEACSK